MSTNKFYTPRFVKMANVSIGNRLNPVLTGKVRLDGQIDSAQDQHRDLVLDHERERSHYFDGKLLKAQDLLRDQNYLDARLRQAGRAFGAGIINGLEASMEDGWVKVLPGSGITPSGLVLELKDHTLSAPVNNAALRQALNRGRHGYLNTGLYLLLLSWHEQTSDAIAEVYPRKASIQPQAQPDAYQQGVKLELMPLQKGISTNDELLARAQLANEFLNFGVEYPGMPSDSLPVALIAVRNSRPLWLVNTLVRRNYRDEREPFADRLRHRHQYSDLLEDLVFRRHSSQAFELNRYYSKIPAMGQLPKSFVDPANQSFKGFPAHYQMNLVPVREEDISFLMSQTAHLPAVNLRSRKSENIQVLVPLSNRNYESLVAALEANVKTSISNTNLSSASLAGNFNNMVFSRNDIAAFPFERMLSARISPRLFSSLVLPTKSAWEKAFDTITSPTGLYYMREFQLAAIQAPQILPISAGFPQAVQPEVPVDLPPVDLPVEPPIDTPVDEPPIITPQPVPKPTINEIIAARGSINEESTTIIRKLNDLIIKQQKTFIRLFSVLDNVYDRLFWRALSQADPADKFLLQFMTEVSNGTQPSVVVDKIGADFGLKRAEINRWTSVAKAVGEII